MRESTRARIHKATIKRMIMSPVASQGKAHDLPQAGTTYAEAAGGAWLRRYGEGVYAELRAGKLRGQSRTWCYNPRYPK